MARAPHESDSSGSVVVSAHRIATSVKAEPETRALATDTIANRKTLKKCIRNRQDAEDAVMEAEGVLSAAARRTNSHLKVFGQRYASAHATPRQKGEKSAPFLFVFDNKTPSKALPRSQKDRPDALEKMTKRIRDAKKAGAEAPKLAADFLKAVEREGVVFAELAERKREFDEAREAEEAAKRATVVAVRAMANAVQAKFAAEPALAREVLGYGDAAATRKKNVATQKKAAKVVVSADE